jgi:hypothetical protein
MALLGKKQKSCLVGKKFAKVSNFEMQNVKFKTERKVVIVSS